MTLPVGIYSSIMQGLAGSISDGQKASLWTQFTQTNGLTTTPPETPTTEAEFVSFLINNANTQSIVMSPEEIQRRQAISSVIDIIIQVIKSVQETDIVQNALLLFYSKSE